MSGGNPTEFETAAGRRGRAVRLSSFLVHDELYETIFAFPRMVEGLLRGFAACRRAGDLDFSALRKLAADYVSDDWLRRHGDGTGAQTDR